MVAIFSFWFQVLYFTVGYQLTVTYLTKHENQIVFHTVKQEVSFPGKKNCIGTTSIVGTVNKT